MPNCSRVLPLAATKEAVYFADGEANLWKTRGSVESTTPLHATSLSFVGFGVRDNLFATDRNIFWFEHDTSSLVLWRTDGTPAGKARLAAAAHAADFLVTEDLLFFVGQDDEAGPEPWVSDGTQDGTRRFADSNPGPDGSFPTGFTRVQDTIFFTAYNGTEHLTPAPGAPTTRRGHGRAVRRTR